MCVSKIHQGDVLETLRTLGTNSFDAAFCDPPYGLSSTEKRSPQRKSGVEQNKKGFMGLEWDGQVPGPLVWRELLRCLVPGAMLLAFGGTRTHHRLMCAIEDGGFEIKDCLVWLHSQGFPKSYDLGDDRGTALKPAWEPVILATKAPAGSLKENFETWGVAGLNIGACRVEHAEILRPFASVNDIRNAGYNRKSNGGEGEASADRRHTGNGSTNFAAKPGPRGGSPLGRWPANVILDETSAELLDQQTGILTSGANPTRRNSDKFRNTYSDFEGQRECEPARGADAGGASRFFYCAKASASERDGNVHPTVKPLKLTEYLARLILPPKRDVPRSLIVPFSGSGSEMLGAITAGWDEVTGIEREEQYIEIARARMEKAVA